MCGGRGKGRLAKEPCLEMWTHVSFSTILGCILCDSYCGKETVL